MDMWWYGNEDVVVQNEHVVVQNEHVVVRNEHFGGIE